MKVHSHRFNNFLYGLSGLALFTEKDKNVFTVQDHYETPNLAANTKQWTVEELTKMVSTQGQKINYIRVSTIARPYFPFPYPPRAPALLTTTPF